tara:strand:- start:1635 stop:2831 length:1197 start_codon:yes stop_codon:yes gene_type:complete
MQEVKEHIATKKLIPQLRFKEFYGAWEKTELEKLTSKISVGLATEVRPYVSTKEEIPLLRNQNIKAGYFDNSSMEYIIPEFDESNKTKRVQIGDVIIVRTGSNMGNACVVPNKYEGSQTFTTLIVRPSKSDLNSEFLSYHINYYGLSEVQRLSAGGGKPNLNAGFLKKYRINIGKIVEQQKIASFLSAVDEKIQQLTKKKALLEQYKKGVMQQLFSGQLRFKDENGKDYPDWEDMNLGDCLDYVQPTKFLVSSTEYNDSYETPVLTAGKTFILGYTNEKENICNKYPLIIFDDFTTATQYVDFPFKAKSSAMKLLIPKAGVVIKFMYEAMQNIKFEIGGHGRHWISIFSQLVMSIPSIEEQQKIATYLSSIDTKIEAVTNQITQNRTFKKGLLQKMFV